MNTRRYVFKGMPPPVGKKSQPTREELVSLVRRMANLIDEWDTSMGGDGKQPLVLEARKALAAIR